MNFYSARVGKEAGIGKSSTDFWARNVEFLNNFEWIERKPTESP